MYLNTIYRFMMKYKADVRHQMRMRSPLMPY